MLIIKHTGIILNKINDLWKSFLKIILSSQSTQWCLFTLESQITYFITQVLILFKNL